MRALKSVGIMYIMLATAMPATFAIAAESGVKPTILGGTLDTSFSNRHFLTTDVNGSVEYLIGSVAVVGSDGVTIYGNRYFTNGAKVKVNISKSALVFNNIVDKTWAPKVNIPVLNFSLDDHHRMEVIVTDIGDAEADGDHYADVIDLRKKLKDIGVPEDRFAFYITNATQSLVSKKLLTETTSDGGILWGLFSGGNKTTYKDEGVSVATLIAVDGRTIQNPPSKPTINKLSELTQNPSTLNLLEGKSTKVIPDALERHFKPIE